MPPPANAPYSRWAGCHFFRVLPHKGQACGPRARKQVSTTTEPSPFRAAGQRRLQTERSKPPGTNAPGISAPASSPPLSETGWLQLGRASPIEAALSNTPFQPVSLPPPANAPYSRWAGCHFFRVLPHKGQACGPRARKQVSTTTEPSPFRAAGQRRLQTERSKPPGTNAPGISAPASSPPLSETGWLQLGRASPIEAALSNTPFQPVSLPPPANAPYSRWAGCHFFRVLPHKGQACGPRARKQVSTTTEPSLFRAAGQRRLQTERSKLHGTNAPGHLRPRKRQSAETLYHALRIRYLLP